MNGCHSRLRKLCPFTGIFIFLLTFFHTAIIAQHDLTFYQDVQPVIHAKCFGCHHVNGPAPFPLFSYYDVSSRASMIQHVVEIDYMPPWPPDHHYSHFKYERVLSQAEKELIFDWINQGKIEGKAEVKLKGQVKKERTSKEDIKIEYRGGLQLTPSPDDSIIIYEIPFAFDTDHSIKRIIFYSNYNELIHHCNYIILNEDQYSRYGHSGLDFLNDVEFIGGYGPGNMQYQFPDEIGFTLPAKGYIVGEIHVPSVSNRYKEAPLEFGFKLYTHQTPHTKRLMLLGSNVKGLNYQNFEIPADSIVQLIARYTFPFDAFVISVNPHMHLLGKSIKAFAILPYSKDTIPLINVDEWIFEWQDFYEFLTPLLLPKGTEVYIQAVYDNTSNNPRNPNSPPRTVYEGWMNKEEMMSFFMMGYPAD